MKLCFATNNQNKVKEVWQLLTPDFFLLSLKDIGCEEELEETQPTLAGNSLQKAQYVLDRYKVPCFADDTGLEVAALNGAPGVYSARYAGPQKNSDDNIALLLQNLKQRSDTSAQFRTVITLVGVDSKPLYFEGIVRGRIIQERRGTQGFGYDPVFIPEGFDKTFAEMPLEEKNKISHRAIAFGKLINFLNSIQQQ